MNKGVKFDGTMTPVEGQTGKVNISATKTGTFQVESSLGADSITSNTVFTVSDVAVTYAGEGNTSLSKKLTLDAEVQQNGIKAEFVDVAGQNYVVAVGGKIYKFIKVTDTNGNAIANKKVYVSGDNAAIGVDHMKDDMTGLTGNGTTVNDPESQYNGMTFGTTDADGVVAVSVERPAGKKSTIISAKVEDLAGVTLSSTISWRDSLDGVFGVDQTKDGSSYKVVYNKDTKTITVPFTKNIEAKSLNKDQFTVTIATKKRAINKVELDGAKLIITLDEAVSDVAANEIQTISYAKKLIGGVVYSLTSVDGDELTSGQNIVFSLDKSEAPTDATNSKGTVGKSVLESAFGAVKTANVTMDGTKEIYTALKNAVADAKAAIDLYLACGGTQVEVEAITTTNKAYSDYTDGKAALNAIDAKIAALRTTFENADIAETAITNNDTVKLAFCGLYAEGDEKYIVSANLAAANADASTITVKLIDGSADIVIATGAGTYTAGTVKDAGTKV